MEIEAGPIDTEESVQPPQTQEAALMHMEPLRRSPFVLLIVNIGMLIWNSGLMIVALSMFASLPQLVGFAPNILVFIGLIVLFGNIWAGVMVTWLVSPQEYALYIGIGYSLLILVASGTLTYFITILMGICFLGYYLGIMIFCQWLWKNPSVWIGYFNQVHQKL